jgi:hypothetical protein
MSPSFSSPTTDTPDSKSPDSTALDSTALDSKTLDKCREQLLQGNEKAQRQSLAILAEAKTSGWFVLQQYLETCQDHPPTWQMGSAYRALWASGDASQLQFLAEAFPLGLVPLESDRGVDYEPVEQLLLKGEYEEADRQTLVKMCEAVGPAATKRKWLYFSEVDQFPAVDLKTLDRLWWVYSEGQFGFLVQRKLWISVGKTWEKLWPMIGWKSGNTWTRYPGAFTWTLAAPKGHLPLSNQLRGVRAMNSLMNHPAFTED